MGGLEGHDRVRQVLKPEKLNKIISNDTCAQQGKKIVGFRSYEKIKFDFCFRKLHERLNRRNILVCLPSSLLPHSSLFPYHIFRRIRFLDIFGQNVKQAVGGFGFLEEGVGILAHDFPYKELKAAVDEFFGARGV
jgi:hypothetical protein